MGSAADCERAAAAHFFGERARADGADDPFAATLAKAAARLERRELAVIALPDAMSCKERRAMAVRLAKAHDALPVALLVGDQRPAALSEAGLRREGFRILARLAEAGGPVRRVPLPPDKRGECGPFDIIGDVHGCYDELVELLGRWGYVSAQGAPRHPAGRRAIFLGDLTDRGPRNADCLDLVMRMRAAGSALCVLGNHDEKLLRRLLGNKVQRKHGLNETAAELEARPAEFRAFVAQSLAQLSPHYWLEVGRLIVAHAGLKAEMAGRVSARVESFALYGDTTGEVDADGFPVRRDWAASYTGDAAVVYGHTPVAEARWRGDTICVDTGCVFGGHLTALRWPERETVSVPAKASYVRPVRPLA